MNTPRQNIPMCFKSNPSPQAKAENGCDDCDAQVACLTTMSPHERLWRAEQAEHQKTHERLRKVEVENGMLRGINLELGKENNRLLKFTKDFFDNFVKEFVDDKS